MKKRLVYSASNSIDLNLLLEKTIIAELLIINFHRYLEEYQRMYKEASTDVSKYLANPINAFVLVKRLTSDWKEVEDTLVKNSGEGESHASS